MLEQVRQLETASKAAAKAGNFGQSVALAGQAKQAAQGLQPFQAAAKVQEDDEAAQAAHIKQVMVTAAQHRQDSEDAREEYLKEETAAYQKRKAQLTAGAAAIFASGMGAITHLSALSDPWGLDRFQKASADLGAVIGRELVPYLHMATEAVRFAADMWVAIPRPIRLLAAAAVAAATATAGLVVANTILSSSIVVTTVATIRASAANLTLAGSLVAMGNAAIFSARWLMRHPLIALATVAVGAAAIRNYQKDASFGAAIREPSIGTVESYLDALQLDALKAGTNIAEQQLTTLQEIKGLLDQPRSIVKEGLQSVGVGPGLADRGANFFERGTVVIVAAKWLARQFED